MGFIACFANADQTQHHHINDTAMIAERKRVQHHIAAVQRIELLLLRNIRMQSGSITQIGMKKTIDVRQKNAAELG